MIPLAEINSYANKYKVPAETIEKDYVISWILICLAKSKLKNYFTFYGGTAIKRIYFENHRFSEDIDLISSDNFRLDKIVQDLDILQEASSTTNLLLEIDEKNIITKKDRIQLYIRYDGYSEIIGAAKEIRMDFAMNMDSYGKTTNKKIIASYSDLNNQTQRIPVMTLNTILANKLGLLIDLTRNEPRDIYDIWFLLQRTDDFDFDSLEVCKIFKEKYGFQPSFNILINQLKNHSLKANWENRLRKQIAELPDIKLVLSEIENHFNLLFI